MMLKKATLILLWLAISNFIVAQSKDSIRATTLSINLPGIIDIFDANITLGADFKCTKTISAGLDAGYIYASIYTSNVVSTSGIILRPYVRFYIGNKEQFFFQTQLHYKSVNYIKEEWVGSDPVNGVPSFSQLRKTDNFKKAFGIHLLLGVRGQLSKSNEHFLAESTIGLGIRTKKQESENGSFNTSGFVFGGQNKAISPVLLFNVKLCYRL